MPTSTLSFVLLDTVIVVELHVMQLWGDFCRYHNVCLPGTVISESQYYDMPDGTRHYLNLIAECDKTIHRIDANGSEEGMVLQLIPPNLKSRIHQGELEALALMRRSEFAAYRFCTSDGPALEALYHIGKHQNASCLEDLLRPICVPLPRLDRKFGKNFVEEKFRRARKGYGSR